AAPAHDVAEADDESLQLEALDIRRDERLAGELAGPVQRDGQVPEVLLGARLGSVAVDGAARREDEALGASDARGLEGVVGRDGPLLEVEPRALEPPAGLGIRREMENDVVALHGLRQLVEVQGVGLDDGCPAGLEVLRDELNLAHREVVVDGHSASLDEQVDEMAPDEACSTDDEESHGRQYTHHRDSALSPHPTARR